VGQTIGFGGLPATQATKKRSHKELAGHKKKMACATLSFWRLENRLFARIRMSGAAGHHAKLQVSNAF
jgi:hypothetical protein